jgi:hypothetical protein
MLEDGVVIARDASEALLARFDMRAELVNRLEADIVDAVALFRRGVKEAADATRHRLNDIAFVLPDRVDFELAVRTHFSQPRHKKHRDRHLINMSSLDSSLLMFFLFLSAQEEVSLTERWAVTTAATRQEPIPGIRVAEERRCATLRHKLEALNYRLRTDKFAKEIGMCGISFGWLVIALVFLSFLTKG